MKAVEGAGDQSGGGENGGLSRAETLKAEKTTAYSNQAAKAANRLDEVKGRMLRSTPGSGEIGRIQGVFHYLKLISSVRPAKNFFVAVF